MFQFLKQFYTRIFSFTSTDTSQTDVISKHFNDTKINVANKKVEVKVIKHQINVESVLEKQKAYLLPQIKNAVTLGSLKSNTETNKEPIVESTEVKNVDDSSNLTISQPVINDITSSATAYQTDSTENPNLNYTLLQESELSSLRSDNLEVLDSSVNSNTTVIDVNLNSSNINGFNYNLDVNTNLLNQTNTQFITTVQSEVITNSSNTSNVNVSQSLTTSLDKDSTSTDKSDSNLSDFSNGTNTNPESTANLSNTINLGNTPETKTNLFKLTDDTNKPEISYKVNLNNQLGSSNCSVSNDVVAKLIVSKLHNDRVIDKDAKITITDSCTYNGNDIFISSDFTYPNIRLMDLLSPNNIHLNLYSDRVKGVSVDVVNKQFVQCSIQVRNQILRLLMNRDRLGNQYIGDEIVMLRCVIDDELFKSISHLVVLKKPTVYNLKDNINARVIFYLFVSSRDVKAFDQSLDVIIKKIKQLKQNGNLFDNISSIEDIWQEIASIDWHFEQQYRLNLEKAEDKNSKANANNIDKA